MSTLIPDTFDNALGFTGYDVDPDHQPAAAQLNANQHVDIRIFDKNGLTRPRTMGDLDTTLMSVLDLETMAQMETVLTSPGETWSASGNGGVISTSVDAGGVDTGVGMWATYNLWRALKFDCNGVAINKTLLSDWPTGSTGADVDISQMNTLSVIIDDSALTGGISGVVMKLNSDPLGAFGNGVDSANITMTKTGKNWTAAISGITGNCDLTHVRGLSINLVGTATNGQSLYVFAVRAYKSGYDPSVGIDINTRHQAAMYPVTVNLASATAPIMIRGTTTNDPTDPRTQDATGRLLIRKGLNTVTSPTYNTFGLVFREDRATDHFVIVYLDMASNNIQWRAEYHNAGVVAHSYGPFTLGTSERAAVLAETYFSWQVEIRGENVISTIRSSDSNEILGPVLYAKTQVASGVTNLRGRQGWFASLVNRDIQIQQFFGFGLAFSTLITKAAVSITPVDAVQLTAAYSLDDNLFSTFSGVPPPDTDQNRTLSADGSYLTQGPIWSNSFIIYNFEQAYLEFDIWVPSQVAKENQPALVMRSPVSTVDVNFTALDLQGNQWNHIYIDLAETQAAGGISYQIYLERKQGVGTTYQWNVDNFVIGVRNVAWKARTSTAGNWVEFRDTVNDSGGALHFPKSDRGRGLQILAEALTENAWIGPFEYQPHYAELGKPTYLN